MVLAVAALFSLDFIVTGNHPDSRNSSGNTGKPADEKSGTVSVKTEVKMPAKDDANTMPVYGHWRNFTTKDGFPSDKAYCVRIDGNRVLVGTHDGLAVYENGKWKTYTTKDGLPHNGIVSIDVSELTGDVWIGTLGGLSRWSGGKFENFHTVKQRYAK